MAVLGFELLLRFLWGSALILFWISRKETSERFLRIAFYIGLGTAAAAIWLAKSGFQGADLNNAYYSLASLTLGLALYSFFSGRLARIPGFLLVLISPAFVLKAQGFDAQINFLLSSALLGSVFMGQFLGHWFLTVPNIHIKELKRVTVLMMTSIGLKSAEILWTLFVKIGAHPNNYSVDAMGRPLGLALQDSQTLSQLNMAEGLFTLSGDLYFGLGSYGLIILATRVLWGTLAPLILAGLVFQTVKMRSTQSATGILYAMCVMILIGECAALFFKNTLGLHL